MVGHFSCRIKVLCSLAWLTGFKTYLLVTKGRWIQQRIIIRLIGIDGLRVSEQRSQNASSANLPHKIEYITKQFIRQSKGCARSSTDWLLRVGGMLQLRNIKDDFRCLVVVQLNKHVTSLLVEYWYLKGRYWKSSSPAKATATPSLDYQQRKRDALGNKVTAFCATDKTQGYGNSCWPLICR